MSKAFLKFISLLISIMLLSSVIVGCGGKAKDKTDVSAEVDPLAALINKPKNAVTLTFIVPGWRQTNAITRVFNEIKAKTVDSLNVELEFKHTNLFNTDGDNNGPAIKLSRPFEKQEVFDAMIVDGDFSELVEKGLIMDLTDLIPSTLYSKLGPSELNQVTYNGRIMGIPSLLNNSQRTCVAVRADLLEECGFQNIADLNDYGRFLGVVKDKKPGIIPSAIPPNTEIFMQQNGYLPVGGGLVYKWDDPGMKLIPWEQTNGFKDAYRALKDWTSKKYLAHDYDGNVIDQMKAGTLASFVWDWNTTQACIKAIGNSYKIKVFPLYQGVPAPTATSAAIVINKDSKHAPELLKFLNWIQLNQENYDLFLYGTKGKDYDIVNDLMDLKYTIAEGVYFGWPGYEAFLNKDYERDFNSVPDGFNELSRQMREDDVKSIPTAGFKPVLGGKLKNLAVNRDLQNRYMMRFMTNGSPNIDDEVKMIVQYGKRQGVDNLIKELQKQLDEWRKSR